jgi:hypothetical protein
MLAVIGVLAYAFFALVTVLLLWAVHELKKDTADLNRPR